MKLTMLLGFALLGALAVAARAAGRPPETRRQPVEDDYFGTRVVDPYRWLEGDLRDPARMGQMTPEVDAWTVAQNTRATLDALPGREAVERRLRELLEVGSVSAPTARNGRYFYAEREGRQSQPVYYWREGPNGPPRRLIDPERLDPSGLTAVPWISPSEDGQLVAFGSHRAGDEDTMLQVMEVDSGRVLGFEIRNRVETPSWLPDGSGFVYRNLRDPKDPYSGQVRFHRMGTDAASDPVLFRQFTRAENEKLATTWGPYAWLSRDGRWLVMAYFVDTQSNDLWVADFAEYLRTGTLARREITVGEVGTAFGTAVGDALVMKTTKGAPNGRVVAVDLRRPGKANWRVIAPERSDAVVADLAVARGRAAITYLENAASRIEIVGLDGSPLGALALPAIGSADIVAEIDSPEAFVTFTSFHVPTTIYRVDLEAPKLAIDEGQVWARPRVPVDPSAIEVAQHWYRSKDGTRVSLFLVHRKGLAKDGRNPTLLNGYGGFGVNQTPVFVGKLFHWLETGGIFALPNLRGGGEYGEAWHEAGMLEKKQNVFDDFLAAAEWLIAEGYTSADRLACSGGSNGGLLTGAMVVQRPDLFRAAIVAVPLLDMLRYQHFSMARYWVPEYGSAEKTEQFPFLRAYPPYHQVREGTRYPGVLLTAGENDSRVHALHARKMAAALQAATAADPAERPILLWVDRESGRGQGKPLELRVRDATDQEIFLRWQLGLPAAPAPPPI